MTRRVQLPGGADAWLVTGFDDVRAALADPRLSLDRRHARGGWTGLSLPAALDANLLNMDPPQHTRIRALVAQEFTPRRIAALRPFVENLAERLLDGLSDAAAEPVDLVTGYAEPLPVAVIGELLGVPAEARADFRTWTVTLLSPDRPESATQAVAAIVALITDLIAARRTTPGGDLLSGLVHARDHGDRLTEDELTSLAFLILLAGYENSATMITNGLLAMLTAPGLYAAVRQDPARAAAIVEESLRHRPPAATAIRRFPTEDLRLGGAGIRAGQTVLLSLAEAGRDPGRYAHPDVFDPDRTDAGHLSFGHGVHYCVGAALARLEGEVALGALARRLPDACLAVPVDQLQWRTSVRAQTLRGLPVRWGR